MSNPLSICICYRRKDVKYLKGVSCFPFFFFSLNLNSSPFAHPCSDFKYFCRFFNK